MHVTCYFDVALCPSSSQILTTNTQISFSRKPRPPQRSLASLARGSRSHRPLKKSQIRQWIFARYLRPYNTSLALITRHNRLPFVVVVVLCNLLSTTIAVQRSSDIPLSACRAPRSNNTASGSGACDTLAHRHTVHMLQPEIVLSRQHTRAQ